MLHVLNQTLVDIFDAINDELANEQLTYKVVRRLVQECGGKQIYFCQPETLNRQCRNKEIRNRYDGTFDGQNGIKSLASRYRLSHSMIRRIANLTK